MFGIAFMVYKNPFMGIDVYAVGFVLLVVAAIMTIWSMIIYLKAAWPFIMMDDDRGRTPNRRHFPLTVGANRIQSAPLYDPAGIAQLVERNLAKVEVASSNLVSRSK